MSHYGPAAANGGRGPRPNNDRRPPFHRQQAPPPPPPMHMQRQQQMNRGPPPPPPPGFGRGMMPGRGRGNGPMMHRQLPPNSNYAMPPQMRNAPPPPPPPPPPDRMNPNFAPQRHPPPHGMPYPPNGPRPPNNSAPQVFQGPHPGMRPHQHQQPPPQQTFHQLPPQMGQPPPMYQQQQHPPVHQHQQHPAMHQPPPQYAHPQPQHPNQPAKQTHQQAPQSQHPPTQHNNPPASRNQRDSAPDADAAWAEHASPTGIPYYYNSVTGVSTYDRPASLGKGAAASAGGAASAEKRTWRTYTDESSGKRYYSDGVTTTWNRPAELGEEEPAKPDKRVGFAEEPAPRKRKKESASSYGSKAEAVAAFKGLLLAKDIAPHAKWNDVAKICSEDPRWEACSTVGERKQALAEYQTKRSNELREVKRLEKGRAKEAFGRLLADVLSEKWHELASAGACRFGDVREMLSKDDRFHSVEDEATREELFYDFIEESRKREERTRRNKKREVKEAFLTLLRMHEERGKLSFASTWSSFVSQLDEKERDDPNFATGPDMSDSDRQLFFADFVIQLQAAEDEKRRRILEARQRAEKAQRDAYRSRLRAMAEGGRIRPDTRWSAVQEKIALDAAYPPVYAQRREAPRELFEDFVDEWNDEYRRERAVLNRALGMAKEFKFDDKTTIEGFRKQILDAASPNPDLYAEVRRILIREDVLSTCALLFGERKDRVKNNGGSRVLKEDESSEDEGEIIEQS